MMDMATKQLATQLRSMASDTPLSHPSRKLMIGAADYLGCVSREADELRRFIRNLLSRLGNDPAIADIMAQAESMGVE